MNWLTNMAEARRPRAPRHFDNASAEHFPRSLIRRAESPPHDSLGQRPRKKKNQSKHSRAQRGEPMRAYLISGTSPSLLWQHHTIDSCACAWKRWEVRNSQCFKGRRSN